jgi:hypothetical protein
MSEKLSPNDAEYDVGYGKPPRHSQFVPGQSGYRGRRKKRPESHAEIIAQIRDEIVVVNGQKITKFKLAVLQVFNQTIKSGKPRDIKVLLELLDKYGAVSQVDLRAQMEADAASAMARITRTMSRIFNLDPADVAECKKDDVAESELVMGCPQCGPALKERWKAPAYLARLKRNIRSGFHKVVVASRDAKS